MLHLLTTLAFFGAAMAVPRRTTTAAPFKLGIAGAPSSDIEKHPYEVSIERSKSSYCSGAIVSPTFVLTSAVCALRIDNNTLIRSGSSYRAQYGDERPIKRIIKHQSYDQADNENNIALLEVSEPFNAKQIVELAPPRYHIDVGNKGVVSGWGKDNKHEGNRHLYEIFVTVLDEDDCVLKDRNRVYDNEFCAKIGCSGRSLTFGDEGAPLVAKGFEPKKSTLLGLVSIINGQHCQGQEADLYIDVGSYRSWIDKYVKCDHCDPDDDSEEDHDHRDDWIS